MLTRDGGRQTSLDGEWRILFDPENRGMCEGWFRLGDAPAEAVPASVPACWEEVRPGYDGVAWYWRRLRAPAGAGRVLLHFEAVNYLADVWVDGSPAGRHEGGYTPFTLDVSECVRPGEEQTLVVRVLAPPRGEEGIDGIVLKETPCWRAWESYNFGGIWQSVHLLAVPRTYIADCFAEPLPSLDAVAVHLTLAGDEGGTPVSVECAVADAPPVRTTYAGAGEVGREPIRVPIEEPRHWSPESPHRYRLRVRVEAGGGGDEVTVPFGLRRLELRENRFFLNGRPLFIKGGFHEGLYPVGLPKPPSRDFVADELRKAKAAGFNLLRFWQIPIHPWVLDAADELGMMLMDEPPIEWITQTERTVERCRREVEELVRRDRSRPSVVVWTILNESGICPDYNRVQFGAVTREEWEAAPVQGERDALCRLARSLDPTRPIIDDSGGWVNGARLYLPYSEEGVPFNDIHRYRRAPTTEGDLRGFNRLPQEGDGAARSTLFPEVGALVSEFGYGSFPELGEILRCYEAHGARPDLEDVAHHRVLLESLRRGLASSALARHYPDADALCRATQANHAEGNALQVLALRANPMVAGYVMHAFSAGGCILGAELFDTWRRPKQVAHAVTEAQKTHVLAVFLEGRNVLPGGAVRARVVSVCDADPAGVGTCELSVLVRTPGETRSPTCLGAIRLADRIQTLWDGEVPLGDAPGEYRLQFCLARGRAVAAVGERKAFVIAPRAFPSHWRVCVLGCGRTAMERALAGLSVSCVPTPAGATHVLVVANEAPVAMPTGFDNLAGTRGMIPFGFRELAAGGRHVVVLARDPQAIRWAQECFELGGRISTAIGHWSPVCHSFEEPALQEGLPADVILGQAFAGVLPTHCLIGADGRSLAGCFSYIDDHIFSKQSEVWWGKTILSKPYGRGAALLCTYNLGPAALADPAARNLLASLLERSLTARCLLSRP